jgi:class 3 adenylate cyclase
MTALTLRESHSARNHEENQPVALMKPHSQMAIEGLEERKLAAIMFTDMVGYSALAQRDESLALELLDEHRALLRPAFLKHQGQEVKTIGDGFLVEFASAVPRSIAPSNSRRRWPDATWALRQTESCRFELAFTWAMSCAAATTLWAMA